MLLRRVTKTKYGEVIDYIPGHIPQYLLLIRLDDPKIPLLEKALPEGYSRAFTSNMGDRICYSFRPDLTRKEIKDITGKLIDLGVQSFEFRDWTNKISPPTKERVIKTKHAI